MNKTYTIAKKELKSFFYSPIAYIVLVVTIGVFNVFFLMILEQNREASLRDIFRFMEFMFIFIIPLFTMKIFSEEKATGTIEFLMTSSTSNTAIVLGKYLGTSIFFTLLVLLTGVYYFIVEYFASPDRWEIFIGYLGIWLEGALFVAIGLMTSSWTRNQIVAAITSYMIFFLLYFSISFIKYFTGTIKEVIYYIGVWSHLENLSAGLILLSDLVYFLSGIIFCMLVTRLSIENRIRPRWSAQVFYLVLSLCFFLVLVSINYAASRLPIRMDFTQFKQHTLTETTIGIVRKLQDNVQFTAFYVGIPPKYLEDLLKEYERVSQGKIKPEIVDPLAQLGYAAKFGNVINSKENKVIVQSANVRTDIDFTQTLLTEEMLTNALIKMARPKRQVYFLTGHGEYNVQDQGPTGLSALNALLNSNHSMTENLMLAIKNKIPSDTDLLVIAGAKNPLTDKEEEIIREYLNKGGKALFLIEATPIGTAQNPLTEMEKQKNPTFNGILKEWGLKIGDDVVVDLENYIGGDVGIPVTKNYPPHKEIVKGLDYTFYIRPRSIVFIKDIRPTVKVAPLVLTASENKSWAETDKTLTVHYDELLDIKGPVPIAAVAFEPNFKEKKSDTRIVVFTDADFLNNQFLTQYSNADIALNTISWLTDIQGIALVKNQFITVQRLDLTSQQLKKIIIILILMPALIALSGIGVWLRHRT